MVNRMIRICVLLLLGAACCGADTPARAEDASMDLRVMSFNIRFGTANDGPNSWPARETMVHQVIREFDPDLLGTQEVVEFQAKSLREALPGYGFIGVGRTDGKQGGEFCPLMYKSDRFQLLDSGTFWLSETPEVAGSKSWDSSLPRIATWARLADRRTDATLLVCNTHFDHLGQQARLESAKLLQQRLPGLAKGAPVVLMGDFNTTEDGAPYKVLTQPEEGKGIAFVDSYRAVHPQRSKQEATYNGFRGIAEGSRIDWIVYGPGVKASQAAIDRTQKDGRYPSDHYPVTAVLRVEKVPKSN